LEDLLRNVTNPARLTPSKQLSTFDEHLNRNSLDRIDRQSLIFDFLSPINQDGYRRAYPSPNLKPLI